MMDTLFARSIVVPDSPQTHAYSVTVDPLVNEDTRRPMPATVYVDHSDWETGDRDLTPAAARQLAAALLDAADAAEEANASLWHRCVSG